MKGKIILKIIASSLLVVMLGNYLIKPAIKIVLRSQKNQAARNQELKQYDSTFLTISKITEPKYFLGYDRRADEVSVDSCRTSTVYYYFVSKNKDTIKGSFEDKMCKSEVDKTTSIQSIYKETQQHKLFYSLKDSLDVIFEKEYRRVTQNDKFTVGGKFTIILGSLASILALASFVWLVKSIHALTKKL